MLEFPSIINSSKAPRKHCIAFDKLDGSNLANNFCQLNQFMSKIHYPFPSIIQFANVKRNVQYQAQYVGTDAQGDAIFDATIPLPVILYEATVKLHGTNAGIVFVRTDAGIEFYCQSREKVITPEQDNAGFANYINSLAAPDLDIIIANFPKDWRVVTVYGEWAGRGIQKNVAISELPKSFYPFAARLVNTEDENEETWLDIRGWDFPDNIHNIYKFPVIKFDINFAQPERDIYEINQQVLAVENECPVAKYFGVSSVGEGLVLRPVGGEYNNSKFWFKAKGEKHANSNVRKLATVDIEKFETEQAFIKNALDEERLEQGRQWLLANDKSLEQKSVGDFIRWVFCDVVKEKKSEMEVSGIKEKDLGKLLAPVCRQWFFTKLNQV